MIIYEGYFNDLEQNSDDIIQDIEQSSIKKPEDTSDYNYSFDIYLNNIDTHNLIKFDSQFNYILDHIQQIKNYNVTYRNFTICNCEIVEEQPIPNCDYFGVTGVDENGEDILNNFETPDSSNDNQFITKNINGVNIVYYTEFSRNKALYAHIKLEMQQFKNTKSYMNFINSIYRLCSKYISKFDNNVDYLMTTGDLNGRSSAGFVDIGILAGKQKPYSKKVLDYISISDSLDTVSGFIKGLNKFKFCQEIGYSIPDMICEMNNLYKDKRCLGICSSAEIAKHISDLKDCTYYTTSWYNLSNGRCTQQKNEIQGYINIITSPNTNAHIYKSNNLYYAFIDTPYEFENTIICRYLYLVLNFNPLDVI